MINLQPFIDDVERLIAAHDLGRPGAYRRWTLQDDKAGRDLGLNPYGCADAANLLYTIGRFPQDPAQRQGFIDVLQGLQDPATGLFSEPTHHQIHCTAHCIAALELFDRRPRHRLAALEPFLDRPALEAFLDGLDWLASPWNMSHRGAGLFAALVLAHQAPPAWQDWYFDWLAGRADPATGFWRKGCVPLRAARVAILRGWHAAS